MAHLLDQYGPSSISTTMSPRDLRHLLTLLLALPMLLTPPLLSMFLPVLLRPVLLVVLPLVLPLALLALLVLLPERLELLLGRLLEQRLR